jgi:hypothetical protein
MITEYKIYYEYYNRYSHDEVRHATFSTLEAMEERLETMRDINKASPTYFNIVCKKETVEILDL